MEKTIITATDTEIHLTIAQEYVGKTIEVTYRVVDEAVVAEKRKTFGDFFGTLDEETYQKLKAHTEAARKSWDRDF